MRADDLRAAWDEWHRTPERCYRTRLKPVFTTPDLAELIPDSYRSLVARLNRPAEQDGSLPLLAYLRKQVDDTATQYRMHQRARNPRLDRALGDAYGLDPMWIETARPATASAVTRGGPRDARELSGGGTGGG